MNDEERVKYLDEAYNKLLDDLITKSKEIDKLKEDVVFLEKKNSDKDNEINRLNRLLVGYADMTIRTHTKFGDLYKDNEALRKMIDEIN